MKKSRLKIKDSFESSFKVQYRIPKNITKEERITITQSIIALIIKYTPLRRFNIK